MKPLSILVIVLLFSLKIVSQESKDVYFDFNKDQLNSISQQDFLLWLTDNKNATITKISGYCDSVDSKNYNKKLAERRILEVIKLLEKNTNKFHPNFEKVAFGKDFLQSKIQAENRKVTIFYSNLEKLPESKTSITNQLTEKIKNSKVGEIITLPNIYFFNNSARIVPKSQPILYVVLCAMQDNPKLKIEIQGHICCQPKNDINDVSTSRAKAIYTFLIQNKIDRKRMTFKGYGVSKPIHKIPEKNSLQEDENRRVELLILEN